MEKKGNETVVYYPNQLITKTSTFYKVKNNTLTGNILIINNIRQKAAINYYNACCYGILFFKFENTRCTK